MSYRMYEGMEHTKIYAKYRPTYPDSVFVEIAKYCRRKNPGELSLAIDVGCGNGQSTLPLTNFFQKVIGVDVSENQIIQARQQPGNVSFRVGPAEYLGFQADGSVDLVTVAQAFHWMDADKFYSEVVRILKPGGALVIYGYGNSTLDNENAQIVISEFTQAIRGSGNYADAQRRQADNHYVDVKLPFANMVRNDSFTIEKTLELEDFIGYLSSKSSVIELYKSYPDSNLLDDVHQRLNTIYSDTKTNEKRKINVKWPIFMLLGSKLL